MLILASVPLSFSFYLVFSCIGSQLVHGDEGNIIPSLSGEGELKNRQMSLDGNNMKKGKHRNRKKDETKIDTQWKVKREKYGKVGKIKAVDEE